MKYSPLPNTKPVPLDLRTGCCWPIDTENGYLFCNEPKYDGSKNGWCTEHYKMGIPLHQRGGDRK
jgi:hypothetical protein